MDLQFKSVLHNKILLLLRRLSGDKTAALTGLVLACEWFEGTPALAEKQEPIRVEKAPGRNDLCPCGSGKKYKHCHGKEV